MNNSNKPSTDVIDVPTQTEGAGGASLDKQIATAKQYPRSVEQSIERAESIALRNQRVSDSCFYSYPQGGDMIRGPSIRLAEIMAHAWGNLRTDAGPLETTHEKVVAWAMCHDLETNNAVRKVNSQSIISSSGERYPEHMIEPVMNATISIAHRNAVFSVIPRAYVDDIMEKAMETAWGESRTLEERIDKCLQAYEDQGFSEQEVYEIVDAHGRADIGKEELIDLRGAYNALQDGRVEKSDLTQSEAQSTASRATNEWASEDAAETDSNQTPDSDEKSRPPEGESEVEQITTETVDAKSVDEVVELVESGEWSKSLVLSAEKKTDSPRKTLFGRLGAEDEFPTQDPSEAAQPLEYDEEDGESESPESEQDEGGDNSEDEETFVISDPGSENAEDLAEYMRSRKIREDHIVRFFEEHTQTAPGTINEVSGSSIERVLNNPDQFERQFRNWQLSQGEFAGSTHERADKRLIILDEKEEAQE